MPKRVNDPELNAAERKDPVLALRARTIPINQSAREIHRRCDSCEQQDARYRLRLSNARGEILDSTNLCLDCLTSSKILDVLTPGAVDTGEPDSVE